MDSEETDEEIVRDLFNEQDVDVLAFSYRHGTLRSILILVRSLFLSRRSAVPLREVIASGASVAVVFFRNEVQAIAKATAVMRIDRVLRLDVHSLALVREQLGWLGLCREMLCFTRLALALKGWRCVGRLTYPIFGWLLYRTLQSALAGRSDVTLITTNMQHPLSIGVVWATVSMSQAADFFEHATTPRIVVRDRGYRNVYVNFEHTRHMLVEKGFAAERIHVLQHIETAPAAADGAPIRRVGLCINFLDSMDAIADITEVLRERALDITYRIHDADPRLEPLKRLAERHHAAVSDARHSTFAAFLDTVDVIVAGNSNVIADALIAGRRAVYYWSGVPELFDYYGLVSHYHVPHATSKSTLRALIADFHVATASC